VLDHFLLAAHRMSKAEQEKRAFIEDLKKLPRHELEALANGEKLAFNECAPVDGKVACWLDRFKGTPLFEQAVALEQQELQLDAQRIQHRLQQPSMDSLYTQEDQVRLQKRLLELQLAQIEEEAAHTAAAAAAQPNTPPAPELTGSQGAGAVGAEELDNTEAVHNRPVGSPGLKLSSASLEDAKERMRKTAMDPALMGKLRGAAQATKQTAVKFKPGSLPRARDLNAEATAIGRARPRLEAVADPFPSRKVAEDLAKKLAHADAEKLAFSLPPGIGQAASNVFSKLGPQGTKALVGAGLGAAGGALMGGHDDRGWHPGGMLAGALGGAALGGVAGHVGGNVAEQMARGAPLRKALGAGAALSGRQAMRAARAAETEVRGLRASADLADRVKARGGAPAGLLGSGAPPGTVRQGPISAAFRQPEGTLASAGVASPKA